MTQLALSDEQLLTLLKHAPELEKLEPLMSPQLRELLVDLQKRGGEAYASGEWTVEKTGERISGCGCKNPPTSEETRGLLGKLYLGAENTGALFKSLMVKLGLAAAPKREEGRGR